MLDRLRPRLSFANVTAFLALCVALGGSAYAAATLPKNSVGAKQLRKNSVTSSKVRNGSLRRADFSRGQLPSGSKGSKGSKGSRGKRGPRGASGPPGQAGTARAFGSVTATGGLDGTVKKNVTSVSHPATGQYCIQPASGIDAGSTGALVTIESGGTAAATGYFDRGHPNCPAGQLEVRTYRIVSPATAGDPANETPTDQPFFFAVP